MEIWVHRNGQYAGRFSEPAIREKIADGSLSQNDLAWDEAKALWKPLSEFLAALPAETVAPASSAPAVVEIKIPAAESVTPPIESKTVDSKPVESKPAEVPRAKPPPLPSIPTPT